MVATARCKVRKSIWIPRLASSSDGDLEVIEAPPPQLRLVVGEFRAVVAAEGDVGPQRGAQGSTRTHSGTGGGGCFAGPKRRLASAQSPLSPFT